MPLALAPALFRLVPAELVNVEVALLVVSLIIELTFVEDMELIIYTGCSGGQTLGSCASGNSAGCMGGGAGG